MVDNVGIAFGIAAPSLAVQKLFPLPVFVGRHLELLWSVIVYQRRLASGSVPSVKSKSGVVENVEVAFENRVAVYHCSKFISSFGLVAAILNRLSPTSGDVDVIIVRLAMVEKVGVAVGIRST